MDASNPSPNSTQPEETGKDFIRTLVEEDLAKGRCVQVVTRFPPEPNGFLHIGHAKAICISFGLAEEYGGRCNLRFDDTNPVTEDPKYVAAIEEDVRWLGFMPTEVRHASDYFVQLRAWAEQLIREGKAYVEDLSEEQIREYRGTVTEPGRPSPYRDRTPQENLDLFKRMGEGEFPPGSKVLRAKVDLGNPNMKMRDPLMYRIRAETHYRAGDQHVYPFYDWAHGQSDAIEGVTHSLCSLEFQSNRELYDWYLNNLGVESPPHQYEFARLNLDYTVMSKRNLLQLVTDGHVQGWDDPRMPTLAGFRRRGVLPESIRRFIGLVGVAKSQSRAETSLLDYVVRDDLNRTAPRVLCVLRPLEVLLTNYPDRQVEELAAPYFPPDVRGKGSRHLPFSGRLYIDRNDFMENPSADFFRLAPGAEVRLRHAYVIRCDEVVKDADGQVIQLRCSVDTSTRGGKPPEQSDPAKSQPKRRVKGTIHWVSAEHALKVSVRHYERLFRTPEPGVNRPFLEDLNPDSLTTFEDAMAEPSLAAAVPGARYQFEREGFFFADPVDSERGAPVFNRIVGLKDSWAKITAQAEPSKAPKEPAKSAGKSPKDRRRKKRSASDARAEIRSQNAELSEKFTRYTSELGLAEADADILSGDPLLCALFDGATEAGAEPKTVAKWVINDVQRLIKDCGASALKLTGPDLGTLVQMVEKGELPLRIGREVLGRLGRAGGDPKALAAELGAAAGSLSVDRSLEGLMDQLIAEHPEKFAELSAGRVGLAGFFVGQAMKRSQGKADPQVLKALLKARVESAD